MKKMISQLVNEINTNMIKMNSYNAINNQYKALFKGHRCVLLHNGCIDEIGDKKSIYNKLMAFLPLTK
jgi:hypothetical protein